MQASDVVEIYSLLLERGVYRWVDGGWGIDALLNQQSRPHKDLDALVQFNDLAIMTEVLAERGFTLHEIWEENRWVLDATPIELISSEQAEGRAVATAFVLRDSKGHELDFHVIQIDERGYAIAAWNAEFIFPPSALEGRGTIAGTPVRCLSAEMHMMTHTGYELQAKDCQDLRLLHERFGVAYPLDYLRFCKSPTAPNS